MHLDLEAQALVGSSGTLQIPPTDEVLHKLFMIAEGECEGLGPSKAAEKYGYSPQRYFQLRKLLSEHGATALLSKKRGPKTNYRRTGEIERQVIRHRFLDPDASIEVIAQKLRQTGAIISDRSVRRVIEEYGLQKKTLSVSAKNRRAGGRGNVRKPSKKSPRTM